MRFPKMPIYERPQTTTGKRPTVVVANDDPKVTSFVRLILESGGYEVVGEAVGCEAALEQVTHRRPDVVVLDERMSARDGAWIAKLIRAAIPEALIVICSSTRTGQPPQADAVVGPESVPYLPLTLDRLVR